MIRLKTVFAIAIALALPLFAGCSTFGLAPAQNLQQRILYGYSAVTASLNTLATATAAGTVTPAQAIKANSALLVVASELNNAITLVCGAPPPLATAGSPTAYCATPTNSPSAAAIVATATTALTGISAYLTCEQAKGTSCLLP